MFEIPPVKWKKGHGGLLVEGKDLPAKPPREQYCELGELFLSVFLLHGWPRGHGRSFFARGHALGAVFKQLVRSCAQLLLLESALAHLDTDI